jgi:hypothetical protein
MRHFVTELSYINDQGYNEEFGVKIKARQSMGFNMKQLIIKVKVPTSK